MKYIKAARPVLDQNSDMTTSVNSRLICKAMVKITPQLFNKTMGFHVLTYIL